MLYFNNLHNPLYHNDTCTSTSGSAYRKLYGKQKKLEADDRKQFIYSFIRYHEKKKPEGKLSTNIAKMIFLIIYFIKNMIYMSFFCLNYIFFFCNYI
jgi:hypothetical protein